MHEILEKKLSKMRINMTLRQGMMMIESQLTYARNGINQLTYARNGIKKYRGGTLVGLKGIVNTKGDKPLVLIPKEQMEALSSIWQPSTAEESFLVYSLKGNLGDVKDLDVMPITLYYKISLVVRPTESPNIIDMDYELVVTGASITTKADLEAFAAAWEEYKASKKSLEGNGM